MLSFPPKPLVTMSYRVDRVRFFPSLSTLDMNERSLPIFSASWLWVIFLLNPDAEAGKLGFYLVAARSPDFPVNFFLDVV